MHVNAPNIVGKTWFNSEPIQPEELKSKVVLVDFWTYSCVNCLRTIPFLKKWWGKYKDLGLIIIGIHAPEFEFEKKPENVKQAIQNLGITWPVVLDNNHENWTNFSNHYWPAKYLIDRGYIVYQHFGEGEYQETERVIQQVLKNQDGQKPPLPEIDSSDHEHLNVCFIPTPETYCGYSRGAIENKGGYVEDQVHTYEFNDKLGTHHMALQGDFLATPEFVESHGENAKLLLNFEATEVNLVLHPAKTSAKIKVLLDDKPIPTEIRGQDLDQENQVTINQPKMYNLIKSNQLVKGILSIQPETENFQAYAFTFSGCA